MSSQKSKKQNKKKHGIEENNKPLREKGFSNLLFGLSLIAVLLAGLVLYSNTFHVPFYYDDYDSIVENPLIKNINNFLRLPDLANVNDRFISYLTFALNYHFGQLEVFGYHLVNVAVHLLNTLLVVLLTLTTLNTPVLTERYRKEKKKIFALLVGLLFVSHPIQTQAVSYIIQRMTSLSAMFYLLAVLFYARGRLITLNAKLTTPTRILFSFLLYVLCFTSLVFGVWSKQIVASLPLAIITYELLFFSDRNKKINWKLIVSILSVFVLGVFYFIFNYGIPIEADDIPRTNYLFTQFKVLLIYIKFLFVPIGLNIDHDFILVKSLFDFSSIASLFVLVLLIIIAVKFYKREPIISFSIFWFFITLSIESSIIPIRDVFIEHRLYLPVFGFSILIIYFLFRFVTKDINKYLIFSVMILPLAILTYQRNILWNDPIAMWTDSIKKSPNKLRPYFARGSIYLHNNQFDNSAADMKKVIEMKRDYYKAFDNLGIIYQEKNDFKTALAYHEEAIKINPTFATAYNNRGVCYLYLKDWDKAVPDFQKAVSLFGNYTDAYFNLGYVYFYKQDYLNSIKYLDIALNLNPSYTEIYALLASNYIYIKQLDLAKNTILMMRRSKIRIPNSLEKLMNVNNLE